MTKRQTWQDGEREEQKVLLGRLRRQLIILTKALTSLETANLSGRRQLVTDHNQHFPNIEQGLTVQPRRSLAATRGDHLCRSV